MLLEDFDLKAPDLQALSSREQVVGLFTRLGYNTEVRLPQTLDAMGITSDLLRNQVLHIERIADQENDVLQVYLAEMKSVTMANIQALARTFKNSGTRFLWVLTSDYDRLDFVLLEPTLPAGASTPAGTISFKGAYLRPRVLTVDRRKPTDVERRVLRRFSYTEADADYQFQKLQSAYNIADWAEEYFNNRALFSDYYLKHRLQDSAEWGENPGPTMRTFQAMFAEVRSRLVGQTEDVIRTQLFEPAFAALGFTFRPGKKGDSDDVEPDYYLYSPSDPSKPVAYCSTYVWDRTLDGRDETRDKQTPDENPGAMVVSLLDKENAPEWAIVTNGKLWRLYSRKAHSRATNYYEVDLEEALASPDPAHAFRYIWLLFRAGAFSMAPATPTTAEERSFLDRLLEASELYAKELEKQLKERVFEKIFPKFAEGFIEDIRAREGAGVELGPERLNEVFQGSLTFLYRLLFLLYAEARDLLPVNEQRGYYQKSLTRLKTEVAAKAGNIKDEVAAKVERVYSARDTGLYSRLNELFAAIDAGDPDLNMPLYNGGLFSTQPASDDLSPEAASARFLAGHNIPDRYLAHGLDLLSRDLDAKTHALVFIDYKSLGVRQLGSVYEGLLEFKVRVAQEPMVVVKGKKSEQVIPEREATGKVRERLPKGSVYLENDKRERKASGSYYTPDYIVKYIVVHTVGPVLEEKLDALRQKLREAQRKHSEAVQRKKAFEKQGMVGDDPEKVANTYRHLVDELFDMRVLDPAMGSGHFLVEAVDFITDNMLKFLNAFPWNPVLAELRRTRESILSEMERQGVSVDPARLTDVNLLKRHVLKRCIYGVDLNPMAVELAKVSLWLDSFTLGAPLSFLDHHLKCGNSLIGMRVEEVRKAIEQGQMSLFGSSLWAGTLLATDLMRHVGELEDATADQVRQSRAEYGKALDALAPFKRILDVYASRWFGNEVVKGKRGSADTDKALDFLRSPEAEEWLKNPERIAALNDEQRKVAATALEAAQDQHFFHWELEFPEVFFGPVAGTAQAIQLKESGGFDVTVGNPPYIRVRTLKETGDRAVPYFEAGRFVCAVHVWDIYLLFNEQAQQVLRNGGVCSFIMPIQTLHQPNCQSLRELLLANCVIREIVDLGALEVFQEALVKTCILVYERGLAHQDTAVRLLVPTTPDLDHTPWIFVPQATLQRSSNLSFKPDLLANASIIEKIEQDADPMGNLFYVTFGLRSCAPGKGQGTKDRLILDNPTTPKAQPYMEGREIDRFDTSWAGRFIDYQPAEMYSPRNPSLFEAPKIVSQSMLSQKRLIATLDLDHTYVEQSLVCITRYAQGNNALQVSLHYVVTVINSQLASFYFGARIIGDSLGGGLIHATPGSQSQLPIRRIPFTTPPERREAMAEKGRKLYERCLSERSHESVLGFVEHHLSQQPEEADVVHDLLAYLADRMLALNKEKQAEQKRFLGWLEGELRIRPDKAGNTGLDSLTGKSKLQNYLGDYQKEQGELPFDELKDVLFKNKGRLGTSLADAMFTHRLEEEYEKSLDMLRPIKERLGMTDSLIDQVVYRLYGLTEEEIAIVEGRGS